MGGAKSRRGCTAGCLGVVWQSEVWRERGGLDLRLPSFPTEVGMGGRGSGEGSASLSPFRTGVADLQGASD